MAIVEVKVPPLSESVTEAKLLPWKKRPGEAVQADEILVDLETDKVVLEVPAPAAGVLAEILQPDGATVTAGQVIALLDTEAAASAATAPDAAAGGRELIDVLVPPLSESVTSATHERMFLS